MKLHIIALCTMSLIRLKGTLLPRERERERERERKREKAKSFLLSSFYNLLLLMRAGTALNQTAQLSCAVYYESSLLVLTHVLSAWIICFLHCVF